MTLQVRRSLPLYRKLHLENKILLFFAFLLLLLGAIVFFTVLLTTGQLLVSLRVIAVGAPPVLVLFVIARLVVRQAVRPLRELARVADEISAGNLDPRLDFGIHVNCWEIKNCQQTDCQAYMNFSQQCWYIDDTPCEGYEPHFPDKLAGCRTCEVYQAHRGDEVVQLADAFRHMTNVLKASREELVTSDDFQKRLIQYSFDGIVACNNEDVITIFNDLAESLTGASRQEVIGKQRWQTYFEDGLENRMDIPLSHEPIRRVRGFAPRESAIMHVSGELIDVRLAGISLFERGQHIGKVFFFQDMREIKQLREELIQSERLTAAGAAAAGISHSIRNIMDGFNGGVYIYQVGERRGDQKKMALGWDMILRNVQIISNLASDLLNFAKDRAPVLGPCDLETLVREAVDSLGVDKAGPVEVRVKKVGQTAPVMLDEYSINQCLTNLLRNALEAYPSGQEGTVFVTTEHAGDRAVITIRDDGPGMSPQTISRIKNGMYSTKGSKGTGLGLQVVQKIVNEHRGTLTIDSEEGKGSTFRIEVPAGELPAIA